MPETVFYSALDISIRVLHNAHHEMQYHVGWNGCISDSAEKRFLINYYKTIIAYFERRFHDGAQMIQTRKTVAKPTSTIKVLSNRIPKTLGTQAKGLQECIKAFSGVLPVERVLLFGSYSTGRNNKHSDIDLCVVVPGIKSQHEAARTLRKAIGRIRNKPALSLIPISPERLAEKRRACDPFFDTIMREGVCLAEKD